MAVNQDNEKLRKWQRRMEHHSEKWENYSQKFDPREEMVRGTKTIKPCCDYDTRNKIYHVRNIASELIEAQVDAAIPTPKVTPRHKEDEALAKIIEDMLIDEMDRMPMEVINDMMERTVPIQGGAFLLVEWDNSVRTQSTVGDLTAQYIHPKQVVPQDGVYSGIEDMDFFILKLPQTKEYIKKRYGVEVKEESEEEPEVRTLDTDGTAASDLVTQYVAYYRNDKGGIGIYSWVGDTELEDLEDYQARILKRCTKCGAVVPEATETIPPSKDGKHPTEDREGSHDWMATITGKETETAKPHQHTVKCPYCGGTKFSESQEEYEEVYLPKESAMGVKIPGAERVESVDANGMPVIELKPTKIPYYKPNVYPIIMQKSVSEFGQLLGSSDVDKIADQQNSENRIMAKLMDMTIKGGSFATLPSDATVSAENEEMKVVRLENVADKQMIDTYSMMPSGDEVNSLLTMYSQIYEEARQQIGITDSFQGRRDTTATSGKAKEFAAQQSAGRLESKRVMKEAAYQQIFEAIFKFKLAYADEPRPIIAHDPEGKVEYEVFDRYDFLKQDEAGQWYWNDQFLFSVDTSAPLSRDKEALWQETRMNLQTGAFGDPTSFDTLILFWRKMEEYHYPGAADVQKHLETLRDQQMMMQQQQQMMMQQQQQMQAQLQDDAIEAQAVENILKGGKDGNKKKTETDTNEQPPKREDYQALKN